MNGINKERSTGSGCWSRDHSHGT